MTEKVFVQTDRGAEKMPGWHSWRHENREAQDAARETYGGRAVERRARKRAEAEERNSRTALERRSTKRGGRLVAEIFSGAAS